MEYKEYLMEEALETIIDYRGKTPKKSEIGIPTLSAKSVKNNYINYSECYYISEAEYKRFMVRGFPQVGDILLTTEAPMGMVARLDRDDVAIAQRLLTLRGKPGILSNDYLLYLLQSPYGQGLLKSKETGTTVTGIRQAEFRRIIIKLPDINIQNKITSILNSIDRKISCNAKINYNLRQQVQLLYSQIAAEASNENKIPLVSDEVCRVLPTKITKYSGEKIYIATADVNEHSITNKATRLEYEDRPSRANMQPIPWSLWFAKMKASPKYIFINDQCPELVDDCIFSTGFFGLSANRDVFYYIWAFISSPEFDKTKDAYCSGTTMQALNNDGLEKISVYLPDKDVLDLFTETVEPIFNKIHSNIIENECLCALRDSLLPKLLSGAIDVSNI